MHRAKIIATLGPASDSESTIAELIEAGMDAARLNFSHGDASDHRRVFETVRRVAARLGRPVAILQDLQGPKIRVGQLSGGRLTLEVGAEVRVISADRSERADEIPCSYAQLATEVRRDDRILLDDGRLVLSVLDSDGSRVRCRVEVGGELTDHKGINLPGAALKTPALTAKDRRDIATGLELGVDYVALSFVRSVNDVLEARALLGDVPLIAKIEKPEAIEVIDAIIEAADGIMVARGDLGVEMGPERVPMLQKHLIEQANAHGKLVITATEMLESMRYSPRPTRAEVSDVANAVLDGSDAVMLSGETAVGKYPVAAVGAMRRVIHEIEASARYDHLVAKPPASLRHREVTNAVARACVVAAQEIESDAIICYTESGNAALLISEYRPSARVVAATERPRLYQQLALHWGVIPLLLERAPRTTEETIAHITTAALKAGLVQPGQDVVIAAGSRVDGPSDLIKIVGL